MKKLTPKHIALIIAVAALFVVVYYQVSNRSLFRKKSATAAPATEQASMPRSQNQIKYDVPALRIDLLAHNSAAFDPSGRNLFNYDKPKPTKEEIAAIQRAQEEAQRRAEEERKRMEIEAKKMAEISQQEAAERADLPPPPPPAPQMNFKFIGYLGNPDDKIAVLEEGADFYFVKQGEVVKDHFLIVKVDFDSVVVGYDKPEWQSQMRVLPLGR